MTDRDALCTRLRQATPLAADTGQEFEGCDARGDTSARTHRSHQPEKAAVPGTPRLLVESASQ